MKEEFPVSRLADRFVDKYLYVLRGYRRRLALVVLLFFIISLLDVSSIGMIGPFIGAVAGRSKLWDWSVTRSVFQTLGATDAYSALFIFGGLLIVLYILKGSVSYLVHRRTINFSFAFRCNIMDRLAAAYLFMPYRFYTERNSAEVIHSITSNTKSLADDLLIPSLRLISDSIILVALLALLCWIDATGVLIIGFMVGGALIGYTAVVRPRLRPAGETAVRTHEQIIKVVSQAISGIKEVRTFAVESQVLRQIAQASELNRQAMADYYGLLALPRYMMETVVVIAVIVISLVKIWSGHGGSELVPNLAVFAAAGLRVLPALAQISSSIASMNYTVYALDAVYRDLKFVEAHEAYPSLPQRDRRAFEVLEFDHVNFAYSERGALALNDINLKIRRGQSVGLIGESGAGKTTLVDMLLGFHKPTAGRVLIDGHEIDNYGWPNWRSHIAYLPQNIVLLDDTIKRNIAFGIPDESIDPSRLDEAVRNAQLSALIERLPEGLKTIVGERGVRLSGGERQRIALARGFYFDRDVFILDEATAALDNETERQVIEVIEEFHHKKTLIVIAHRLSTVRNCDVIYRLSKGRIVESGSFEEVVLDADRPSREA